MYPQELQTFFLSILDISYRLTPNKERDFEKEEAWRASMWSNKLAKFE